MHLQPCFADEGIEHFNCVTQVSLLLKVCASAEAFLSAALLFCFSPWWPKQDTCGSVASFLRSAASGSGLPRDLDDVTIPDFSDVSCFALAGGQGCDVGSVPAPSACVLLLFLWFLPFCAFQSWCYSLCRRLICVWTCQGFVFGRLFLISDVTDEVWRLNFGGFFSFYSERGFMPHASIVCLLFHIWRNFSVSMLANQEQFQLSLPVSWIWDLPPLHWVFMLWLYFNVSTGGGQRLPGEGERLYF